VTLCQHAPDLQTSISLKAPLHTTHNNIAKIIQTFFLSMFSHKSNEKIKVKESQMSLFFVIFVRNTSKKGDQGDFDVLSSITVISGVSRTSQRLVPNYLESASSSIED